MLEYCNWGSIGEGNFWGREKKDFNWGWNYNWSLDDIFGWAYDWVGLVYGLCVDWYFQGIVLGEENCDLHDPLANQWDVCWIW